MKYYYFTLSKENAANFYSSNWIIFETERIFGGGVILKTPKNDNKLFRCSLLRSSDTRVLFEIELSEDDMTHTGNHLPYITLIKLTNDKNVKDWTCTLLHYTTEFFDLTPNGYSLKGMLPITKPGWSWDVKPLTMKTTVDSNKSENDYMNFIDNVHKDVIQHYSEADSRINMTEVLKEMGMFESDKRVRIPEIKEVIFNYPATVVYWKDGDKTKVKCGTDEASFDREKAVAMCFLKKMFKPSIKSHWLDTIHDAIQAADDKVAQAEADKAEKARIKAENIAKAEEAKRKKAEKKAKELQSEIQKLETKSLEEMNSKVEGKDEFEEKYKDVPVNVSKNEVSEEYVEKIFDQAVKENKKWAEQETNNKTKKNKIDQDLMLECIKEKLTIDEIAEMNSWDKAAVARMYYKITGTKPEKKPNTYSELDTLFEQGVSVDAAARRTGFSKKIVAMRYAKLQNKKDKE